MRVSVSDPKVFRGQGLSSSLRPVYRKSCAWWIKFAGIFLALSLFSECSNLAFVLGTDPELSRNDTLLELTRYSFDRKVKELLSDHPAMLLQVYAPWCGHCRRFEPTLRRISQQLAGGCRDPPTHPCIPVARIDGDREMVLALRLGVWGFPSFYGLRANPDNPNRPVVLFYNGSHDQDALVAFVDRVAKQVPIDAIPDAVRLDGWRHPFGAILRLASAGVLAPYQAAAGLSSLMTRWQFWAVFAVALTGSLLYWRRRRPWMPRQYTRTATMNGHVKKPQ
jgi:thiol-disulfide isomerase/thioredoxin